MSMKARSIILSASLALSAAASAAASGAMSGASASLLGDIDADAAPTSGSIALTAGFQPDPYEISISGPVNADLAELGGVCQGGSNAAPDVELTYFPGGFPLSFSARGRGGASLAILDPDGDWHCAPLAAAPDAARIFFDAPRAGRYSIWVGAPDRPARRDASLSISEFVSD